MDIGSPADRSVEGCKAHTEQQSGAWRVPYSLRLTGSNGPAESGSADNQGMPSQPHGCRNRSDPRTPAHGVTGPDGSDTTTALGR